MLPRLVQGSDKQTKLCYTIDSASALRLRSVDVRLWQLRVLRGMQKLRTRSVLHICHPQGSAAHLAGCSQNLAPLHVLL